MTAKAVNLVLGKKNLRELFEIINRLDKRAFRERYAIACAEFQKVLELPRNHSRRNGTMNPRKIRIALAERSAFGDEIVFLPKTAWGSANESHPFNEALMDLEFPQNLFTGSRHGRLGAH